MFFVHITFIKDVKVICIFFNGMSKFDSKCHIALLVSVCVFPDKGFADFDFNLIRCGDVKSAPILFRYVGFCLFPYGRRAVIILHEKYFQETYVHFQDCPAHRLVSIFLLMSY